MDFSYDYKELSDEILFNKYQNGDVKAFEYLLNKHKGLIYSLILRSFKDPGIADEIFQEVFFKVCRNKDLFRESVSFKSWLVTICRNTCIDFARKSNRQLKTVSLDGQRDEENSRSLSEKVASEEPTPMDELNFKLENKQLNELLDNLPKEQKETFYLKIIMEMTFEEIGEATDCSVNTAKSRYRYALNSLRGLIKRKKFLDKAVS